MRVVLFYIGEFPVRSYGLIVALAILLSTGIAYYFAKETKYREHVVNVSMYGVIGAMVGARLWEVLFFQWSYYSTHLSEVFAVWNGGLSIQGGLVGGIVSAILYTRIHKISFWELADVLSPAVVFGQAVGRIACFLNGDAFGSPTGSNFGIVYPEGTIAFEKYGSQPLWPAEIWEGQWDMIIFSILLILKNRKWPTGFLFLTYQMLYALGRFLLEFLRGDTPRFLFSWTAAQWTSVSIIIGSLIVMWWLSYRNKKLIEAQEHAH